ncbi:ATP-binding cassette domain-containing protein [Aromatoleum toluvorans]|uniref:ATP-binding cassette domain-containing protein n=1 Tax=Aromatoleum toluvorans TaxID=92002 RepID=A0ABX1PWA8_9RHOO|nr:ABC transporter ATP-binding protein [Aromatoleum toluvorans]NMG42396.1 ATP-binding cassette domain-containing protein [Aromatoleum toluvorans]
MRRAESAVPRMWAGARRFMLTGLALNGIAQAVAALACAWLTHRFFEVVIDHRTGGSAMAFGLIGAMLGAGALLAALRVVERVQAERLGQDYAAELRLALYDSMAEQSPRRMQARSRGATILRFVGDVKGIRRWMSLGLPRIAVGALSASIALCVLALVNGTMAFAASWGFVGAAVALALLSDRVDPAVREARRRQARLAANVNDKIGGIAVVQVFDQVARERALLERQGAGLADAMVAQTRGMALLKSAAEFSSSFATAGVLLAGAIEVAGGELKASQVVGAITAVGLIAPTFRDFGQALGYWRSARVSFEKIAAFLATPRLATCAQDDDGDSSAAPLAAPCGAVEIEFRGVSSGTALRAFSACAPAGATVAIVGPSGAGKSTLLAMAARLLEPDGGEIRIAGAPIGRYRLSELRRALGVVMPDLPLLRGSLERNLRYRWPGAPDTEVARVAALCGVDELLATLPDGAQTRVADAGANLSYGQRQRIAWARALLGSPSVLLLDEADANLDPASAHGLGQILDGFTGTVLMVTHSYARMMQADLVWYVEAGRLLESGAPAELMGRMGRTRRLFQREANEAG